MVNFDFDVLIVFILLSVLGMIGNSAAFYYTVKSLKGVQNSLFFLLVTDSLTSLVGYFSF